MRILILGGTRFFGRHAVRTALERGHDVTIGTRGRTADDFGGAVRRIRLDRLDPESLRANLAGLRFDAVIDNLCYCSNDVRNLLNVLDCGRYVMTSTTAVYDKHWDTRESEFDPLSKPLEWCDRSAYPYEEVKRLAECALFQQYPQMNAAAVRYPFVIGTDDYTSRLRFYVEHALRGIPMQIDNIDRQMGFIRSNEAGAFLVHMAESDFRGSINGCNAGTISLAEILSYVREKTGRTAILSPDGDTAPYNGENEYSISTSLAEQTGFTFSPLKPWIFALLDHYIDQFC